MRWVMVQILIPICIRIDDTTVIYIFELQGLYGFYRPVLP